MLDIRKNLNDTSNQFFKLNETLIVDINKEFSKKLKTFITKENFKEIHGNISSNTEEIKKFNNQFQNLINKTRFNFTSVEKNINICKFIIQF